MTAQAELEVNFVEGKRTIQMDLKKPSDIEDCEEGKVIMINLLNGETLTGFFKGMSGDDIKLGAISGKVTLGYKESWLINYWEEVKA